MELTREVEPTLGQMGTFDKIKFAVMQKWAERPSDTASFSTPRIDAILMPVLHYLKNPGPMDLSCMQGLEFEAESPTVFLRNIQRLRTDVLRILENDPLESHRIHERVWEAFDELILNFGKASESARSLSLASQSLVCDSEIQGALDLSSHPSERELKKILHTRERLAHLVDADKLLIHSLDYEEVVKQILKIALHTLADWCMVDVVMEDESFQRVAVIHRQPEKAALCEELKRDFAPDSTARGVPSRVLRTKKPLLVPKVTDEHYAATSRSPRHEEVLRALGSTSYMTVPFVTRDQFLGAMTLVSSDPKRSFTPEDLLFAEDLASRAALAIHNSQLYLKAQKAATFREEMVGIVSHDLKNPLSAISLSTSLLLRLPPPTGKERVFLNSIDNIQRSTKRMQSLISDLLDLSKVEAGHFVINHRPEPVFEIMDDVSHLFEPLATAQSIQFDVDCPEEFLLPCDRERIIQVLSNLIGNALKFTPVGGSVRVSVHRTSDEAVFEVRDTGPGISPENLPYLFERYWQAQMTSRQGTGLGLAIVRAMVESHEGRTWVESTVGSGSRFYFSIPLQYEKENHAP